MQLKHHLAPLGLLMITLAIAQPAWAESVGRLLASNGEIRLTRNGISSPAGQGALIEQGDVINAGERSTAQIRMSDGTVIALRPNTTLKIDTFVFDPQGERKKNQAAFNLIKGGLRTVTGLIGKVHPEGYQLKTPISTIGIRGTYYVVQECAGDCQNPDGSRAEDGTFGQVFDGRIVVGNQSGSREFGKDESFRVLNPNTPPEKLPLPPAFLSDRPRVPGSSAAGPISGAPLSQDSGRPGEFPGPRNELPITTPQNLGSGGSSLVLPPSSTQTCVPSRANEYYCP